MVELVPLELVPGDAIETLLDAAFGADRRGRTAYRLRKGSKVIADLSFALIDNDALIASIQCWPVRIGDAKLVLVGPVAVDPGRQNEGHGGRLMHSMLEGAGKVGNPAMVMVGDPEYYSRFGFTDEATSGWQLPGPWEARRLLARNSTGHPLPTTGMLERADAL
jgi:predicted N-acetyltransferase YhbS